MTCPTRSQSTQTMHLAFLLALIGTALCLVAPAHAKKGNSYKIEASVDRSRAIISEEIVLTVKIWGAYERYHSPALADFELIAKYKRARTVVVNNVTQSYMEYGYRLRPTQVGSLRIGRARIYSGRKLLAQSNEVTIQVENPSPPMAAAEARASLQKNTKPLFLHAYVTKDAFVAGEPFVIHWDLYYPRGRSVAARSVVRSPRLYETWHRETLLERPNPTQVTVAGKLWMRLPFSRQVVVKETPGRVVVDPLRILVQVGDRFERAHVGSRAFVVPIHSLPKGSPASFRPAQVGQFTMRAFLHNQHGERPDAIKAGEALFLDVTIKGHGNMRALKRPLLRKSQYFTVKQIGPVKKEVFSFAPSGISGTRQFRFALRPVKPGKIDAPDVVFSYFDPETKKYRTLVHRGKPVRVRTVMDTLLGGLTLSEKDRIGLRVSVGWPFVRITHVRALSDKIEISPQFQFSYGKHLKTGVLSIDPGVEVRWKIVQRGPFALAFYANPALLISVPTNGGEGSLGFRLGTPGILASWQLGPSVNFFTGLQIPIALIFGQNFQAIFPLVAEIGAEVRVFRGEKFSVNAHGTIAGGPEFCAGKCSGIKPIVRATVGSSIVW